MFSTVIRTTTTIAVAVALAGCTSTGVNIPVTNMSSASGSGPDRGTAAVSTATGTAGADAPAKTRLAEVRGRYPRYTPARSHDSSVLFDQNKLQRYDIWLEDDSLAFLNNDPAAEKYVEGALVHNGKLLPSVGVRYKGGQGGYFGCVSGKNPLQPSGAKTCTKLSMKIKTNWKDPDARFYGLKILQFHSQNIDPTKMRERLGYWLFGQFGVPSPRSVHARLYINGEYNGIFAMTEQIDDVFVARNFPDKKGDLYKEVWPLTDAGQAIAVSDLEAGLETSKKRADLDKFLLFAKALAGLDKAEKPAVDAVMREWFDLDRMMRYVVVDRAIAADDGIFHFYCRDGKCSNHNYFWYQGRESKKVHLIPWDLDMAFENLGEKKNPFTAVVGGWNEVRNDCQPFVTGKYGPFEFVQRSAPCDKLVRALTMYPGEYDSLRAEFRKQYYNTATVNSLIDQWTAQVEPAIAEAAAAHKDQISVEAWKKAVAKLKGDVASSLN